MEKRSQTKCHGMMAGLALTLSAITLIGGAILGTCIYKKVSSLHQFTIESQFGSDKNFQDFFEASMTEQARSDINTKVQAVIKQIKSQQGGENEESDHLQKQAALNDSTWNENSKEAYTLFGLSGTPANAVVNVKNGNFKALEGAQPQVAFEGVIEDLKAGKELESDNSGKAGKLNKDQITALLKNSYFKGNEQAEIVIVEYSDILCPWCQKHYNERTLENIVEKDENVALVFKNMPIVGLHPNAPLGARGAECAGELGGSDMFYAYLDEAFKETDFNRDSVLAIAGKIGLETEAFTACFMR